MALNTTTPADVFLGLGGKTFSLVGLGFVAIGGIYGVNKLSGSAITVIESIPYFAGMKEYEDGEGGKPVVTKEHVRKAINSYGSITGVILVGTLLGAFGRYISADATVAAANKLLYRS
ncbi:Hypothetical protein HVR_LOCUS702 [uncultured virus]|nr:Hypothetical protein HVR_LOCUS702 [uncultured virus]